MSLKIHNSEAFAGHIEHLVATRHLSYLDAILLFCEKRGIEPDAIAPFINDKIKTALSQEGQRLHLLPRMNALPL